MNFNLPSGMNVTTITPPPAVIAAPTVKAQPAQPAQPTNAFEAILAAKNAEAASKKGKSKAKPEYATGDDLPERWLAAKRATQQAEDAQKALELEMRQRGFEMLRRHCVAVGEAESTVKMNGIVTGTQKAQYSDIPFGCEQAVRLAFPEKADTYMTRHVTLTLKESAAANPEVQAKLLAAFGEAGFAELFDATIKFRVTKAFHSDFMTDEKVYERAKPLVDEGVINPYAFSLRA